MMDARKLAFRATAWFPSVRAGARSLFKPRAGLRRAGLALLAAAFGAIGLALADSRPEPLPAGGKTIAVTATPLADFDKTRTGQTAFGKLTWLGGLVLTSPSKAFGGWSGLALDPGGKRLVAVSDMGSWMTATLETSGGKPSGLASVKIGPLLKSNGKPLKRRRDIDAEGLRLSEGSIARGQVYLAFERNHRIAVADIGEGGISPARRFIPLPPDMKLAGRNEGFEAIAILLDGPWKGALAAFAEHLPGAQGQHSGWLWIDGKPQRFTLSNPGDFSVTDAVGLRDGGLLVLERRFAFLEGVRMRLRHIAAGDLKPGAALGGEVLIEAGQSQEIDNMEGMAVTETPNGETVVTLVSDDNFNPSLQRTVLLQFAWPRGRLTKTKAN